jgi:hypothetical protein
VLNGVFRDVVIWWQRDCCTRPSLLVQAKAPEIQSRGQKIDRIVLLLLVKCVFDVRHACSLRFREEPVPGVFGQRHVRPQAHFRYYNKKQGLLEIVRRHTAGAKRRADGVIRRVEVREARSLESFSSSMRGRGRDVYVRTANATEPV